jgi:N-acetylglucosamine kinase-like BadF-type ATPase
MAMIILGIDGGASKTHSVLVDEEGCVRGVGRAGCSNWETVGLDGAQMALDQVVHEAVANAGIPRESIAASGYGLAGVDWPSDRERLKPVIAALGLNGPYEMVNDAFLPLRAGTVDGVGLGAIAGSGATVVGRNRAGQTARSFGAGYPFTDWGGAWDIAREAVHVVASAYQGLGPETALTGKMLAATGCTDVADLMEKLMRWQVQVGGEFAPQVFQAAREGDTVAQSIVRRAGKTIGANAIVVARRLGMLDTSFDLVVAGGVFSSRSSLLRDSLLKTVHAQAPQAKWVHWQAPPVVGALLLGLDLLDLATSPDTASLAAQVEEALTA